MSVYDFGDEVSSQTYFFIRMLEPHMAICAYDYQELMVLLSNFHNKAYDTSFFRYDYFNKDHYHDFLELATHKEFMDQLNEIIFCFPEDTYRISREDFVKFVAEKHVECFL